MTPASRSDTIDAVATTGADLVLRARRAVVGVAEIACSVAVTGGRIVAVAPYDAELAATSTIDLGEDEVLLPGLVDTHVHINEPGRTEWEVSPPPPGQQLPAG